MTTKLIERTSGSAAGLSRENSTHAATQSNGRGISGISYVVWSPMDKPQQTPVPIPEEMEPTAPPPNIAMRDALAEIQRLLRNATPSEADSVEAIREGRSGA